MAAALLKSSVIQLLRARDALPLLILSAIGSPVVFGQWAPPTVLGFAILGAGFCMASLNEEQEEEELPEGDAAEEEADDEPSDRTDPADAAAQP